jgi:hypothetical protein
MSVKPRRIQGIDIGVRLKFRACDHGYSENQNGEQTIFVD